MVLSFQLRGPHMLPPTCRFTSHYKVIVSHSCFFSHSSGVEDECFDAIRKFSDDLEADETASFEATTKSQQPLHDLQDVDNMHKASISKKFSPKLKVFAVGVKQFGSAIDIIAGSVSLMSPISNGLQCVSFSRSAVSTTSKSRP